MIRVEQSHLPVAARTHPGMAGKQNEDRYAVSAYRLSEENATPALLAVLSDGIGGHRAGEVAAEIAVNQISENLAASDGHLPLASLRESIQAASQGILTHAKTGAHLFGMGATCAVAWIIDPTLFQSKRGNVTMDLYGDYTRGCTTTDLRGITKRPFNCDVCFEVERTRFLNLLVDAISNLN